MGVFESIVNGFCDFFGIETKEEKAAEIKRQQSQPQQGSGLAPATQKEKEEKECQWDDVVEPLKFVCQGGKAQCMFASPPIADLIVTSTQVMLQDKFHMTNKDNNGKVNFNFTGVCNHPSQQKPLLPPPPCKAVISLGEWKDYSETKIDNFYALLGKSIIPCMISGQDLKIIHSGQKAEPSKVKPTVKRNPQITESYWINEDGERIEKIAPNRYASLVIKTKDYKKSDKITVTLAVNGVEKEFVTHVNSKGIAILTNILSNEREKLKRKPRIIEAYWQDSKGKRIDSISINDKASLFIKTEGYNPGTEIEITINKQDNSTFKSGQHAMTLKAKIDKNGIGIAKNKKWN